MHSIGKKYPGYYRPSIFFLRIEGVLDQMLRNSQVVAAFGRRLFDETELKESTTDEEDQEDGEEVQTDLFPPGSPVTSAA